MKYFSLRSIASTWMLVSFIFSILTPGITFAWPAVPIANAFNTTINEDSGQFNGVLIANDADGGDTLTFSKVWNTSHGTLNILSNWNIQYTPNADFCTTDTFTFTAQDQDGHVSAVQNGTINVTCVNDAPSMANTGFTTPYNTSFSYDVASLINDVDNPYVAQTLEVSWITVDALHGVATLSGTTTLVYTPNPGYSGSDTFSISVWDQDYISPVMDTIITMTVLPPANTPPVALSGSYILAEDASTTQSFSGTDADLNTLTFTASTLPTHGSLVLSGSSFTYTPTANYNGSDSFTFVANDGTVNSTPQTISLTVTSVNDAPVAVADTATGTEDTPWIIPVLANDTDVDGTPLSVSSITTGATHGVASISGTGVLYTPTANYCGSDSFSYRAVDPSSALSNIVSVSVSVTCVNDAPVALSGSYILAEDASTTQSFSGTDADLNTLTFTASTLPTHGSLVLSGSSFTYTPTANYNGSDSFTFVANDGTVNSTPQTISLTVTSVNDAPVAVADTATGTEDTPWIIPVLANDTDVDGTPLSVSSITTGATHGVASISGTGVLYTPTANYCGSDSFSYRAVDPSSALSNIVSVSVSVTCVNDAPVALSGSYILAEDASTTQSFSGTDADLNTLTFTASTLPTHGSLVLSGSSFTYTPTANYNGSDSFTFVANDGTVNSTPQTISLTVTSVNDAPVAVADTATGTEDTPWIIPVLANDTDVDGTPLSVSSITTGATHGVASISGTGVLYTPTANYCGSDSFSYRAVDPSSALSNIVSVSVSVTCVNDAPTVPATLSFSITGNTLSNSGYILTGTLTGADIEWNTITFTGGNTTSNGVLNITSTGAFDYIPNLGFSWSDTFTYRVNDGSSNSTYSTVTICVSFCTVVAPVVVSTGGGGGGGGGGSSSSSSIVSANPTIVSLSTPVSLVASPTVTTIVTDLQVSRPLVFKIKQSFDILMRETIKSNSSREEKINKLNAIRSQFKEILNKKNINGATRRFLKESIKTIENKKWILSRR